MSDEAFESVIDANLTGTFRVVRRCAKGMLRKKFGRIILVGSVVALTGSGGQVNYAASKAGLVGMARSIARELGSRGITANVVAPGFVETDMTAELGEERMAAIQRAGPARPPRRTRGGRRRRGVARLRRRRLHHRRRHPRRRRPGHGELMDPEDLLPHREPFLFVTEVLEVVPGERARGVWRLTGDEDFFAGHFPGRPTLPGVLMVEALAQVGALAVLADPRYAGKLPLFGGIDKARFRRQVVPGDELTLEVVDGPAARHGRQGQRHGPGRRRGRLPGRACSSSSWTPSA